jgi:EmrB/QacA subfamily drug resistance transporter
MRTDEEAAQRDRSRDQADLSVEAPGARETGSVPWAMLLQQRMAVRATDSDRYPWIVLFTALFGLLTVTFTITILAVSIPTISEDLGTSQSDLTWLITGPLLVFAVVGPAVGKMGDRHGHRPLYLIGLSGAALFAGATALAWSGPSLIAFRILGATMGAATGPASMAMINTMFPPERRAQAMGFWTMVMAGGPVAGVVIGGPVVEAYSWRWIFIVQVPLTLVSLFVAAAVLPNTQPREDSAFDLPGTLLLGGAVLSALLALNRGPSSGWGSPLVVGGFALAPLLLVVFVFVERRSADPLIPLRYLRRRNFSLPLTMEFFLNFAYMGGFILTPLLLQNVLGYTETRTGLLSIARPLTFAISGPIAGFLAVRIGERTSTLVGTSALVLSMLGLSTVGVGTSDLLILGALALSGIGLGASMPSLAAAIANSVDERDLGVVGASQQMVGQLGVVAGIQILQTVQQAREDVVGEAASYGDAYLVGAAVAGLAFICALFLKRSVRPIVASSRAQEAVADIAPEEVADSVVTR